MPESVKRRCNAVRYKTSSWILFALCLSASRPCKDVDIARDRLVLCRKDEKLFVVCVNGPCCRVGDDGRGDNKTGDVGRACFREAAVEDGVMPWEVTFFLLLNGDLKIDHSDSNCT